MQLPKGWIPVEADASRLAIELRREMMKEHVLYHEGFEAIARRGHHDDTLFSLSNGRYAQVHLTYQVETASEWPWTTIFLTYQDWMDDLAADEEDNAVDES